MDTETLTSYLNLLVCEGIGVLNARRLLDAYGDVNMIFRHGTPVVQELEPLVKMVRNSAKKERNKQIVQNEIRFIRDCGICCTGILEKDYPRLLKECADAPVMLFYKGDLSLLNRPSLAVVGTRKMTAYGKEMVGELMRNIQPFDPVVVSGMAFGVDIAAYQEARKLGIHVAGVMGTGFQVLYPEAHKRYYEDLFDNGLILTEYASFNILSPELFIRRNRIVAGLGQATVVVESAEKGGSLSTAFFARDYGREVYALPGKVTDLMSKGCLKLIQENKAQLLFDFALFVQDLNWNLKAPYAEKNEVFSLSELNGVTEPQKRIIESLQHSALHIDELAVKSGLDMSVLNAELMILELEGIVVGLQGKMFRINKKPLN